MLFLNIPIPLNVFCCVLQRFRSNLLGNLLYVRQTTTTIELTKAIKRTKTRSFKNACFPRFRLGFVSCFVRSSRGGRTGKPRALPVRPPRENRGRCAYDFRRYCMWSQWRATLRLLYIVWNETKSCQSKHNKIPYLHQLSLCKRLPVYTPATCSNVLCDSKTQQQPPQPPFCLCFFFNASPLVNSRL